jgi:hypothetical protein
MKTSNLITGIIPGIEYGSNGKDINLLSDATRYQYSNIKDCDEAIYSYEKSWTNQERQIFNYKVLLLFEVTENIPVMLDNASYEDVRYRLLSAVKSHLTNFNGAEPFLRSRQLCSYSRISEHFMEPEGSLLCLQEPFIGSYPEPDQSSLFQPMISL